MGSETTRPLWHVIQEAYFKGSYPGCSERHGCAAELRALADIIEDRGAQGLDRDPGETVDWLRAEAERAEGQS
jgi:hypothetical protein